MARTVQEQIDRLEKERNLIEENLDKHANLKRIRGQGNEAETEFTDPTKLYERLETVENKLAKLETMKQAGIK